MLYTIDKKRIAEHRAFISSMQEREKRTPARNIKVIIIPMFHFIKKANNLFIVIYRSKNLQDPPYPTLLHIRGTGFNATARYFSYITCSHIAEKSGCQVIDLDHHLAPEYPYPRPFKDVYTSYKSIIHHANSLQIDINKIAISGYSSGGNLAALLTIRAKKDKRPVALQILISPLLDLSRSLKKYVKYENKDSFPNPLADWFIELYLQSKFYLHSSPEISPFWSNFLFNWPPTYFLFGENDRFRSDSEEFYTKLTQFGFWAHKSVLKKKNHSVFWQKMNVLETVSAQLQMGLCLTKIPRQNFSFLLADDEPIDLEKKHQHSFQKKN
ncbi:MAG: alpha/beta hydrolase [Gammaproteobacteria bacterium]|nr:MAG: alpha/beta hydrolase [Gammaproteobacteria bacterium]